MTPPKLKGLGRGLDVLLGADKPTDAGNLTTVAVQQLQPGKYQPRTRMDAGSLEELAASIRAQGLMQPIVVRSVGRANGEERYEIIAGERRWRAAQIAELAEVPVIIREIPDDAALAMSLIENIQREDLNPLEEATGIQRLIDEFGMTHQQAADAVGRSRPATSNLLRLLQLPSQVRELLMAGDIEMGHARSLLALEGVEQVKLANVIVAKRLSVRETEKLVSSQLKPKDATTAKRQEASRDVLQLEEELSDRLGATVKIKANKKGAGSLTVTFGSLDQLDGLLAKLR